MLRLIAQARRPLLQRVAPLRLYSDAAPKEPKDQDIMYVDLNNPESSPESAAATKQFFEYQTGRWLQNDRVERANRTVNFDLKGLLSLLKNKLDYLEKTPDQPSGLAIETLEPFFEGKHNKLYKIVLKDMRSYVLRIPYNLESEEYRRNRLLSEVATLDFIGTEIFGTEHEKFKVPVAISYSATKDNELGTPYVLSSFIGGTKLAAEWKPWSVDIEEKKPVIEPMAEMAGELLKYEFPAYGSIFYEEDMPNGIRINDRFVIGPSMEKRFWRGSGKSGEGLRGPWTKWQDYLKATADVQLAYAKSLPGSPNLKAAERYAKAVPALFTEAEVSTGGIASPRLYDPDFSPMNVFVQDGKYWLIDVENSVVKPYVFHGVPWFVRNPGERIYNLDEIPNFNALPEQDKRILQHFHSLTQSELTYEMKLRDAIDSLILAHHPNLKRREEVVNRAMQTDIETGFFNDIDYAIYRLAELWKLMQLGREFPVEFNEAETDELAKSIAEWNQHLMRNKYLESKGFVPAEEFDQLLGTGALKVIDDKKGDYELTKEFLDQQDPLKF